MSACHTSYNSPAATRTSRPATIAAGQYQHLFLKTTGQLYGIGNNYYGPLSSETPIGTSIGMHTLIIIATNIVAGAAGGERSLGLTASGDLYAAGTNRYGQFGDGTTNYKLTPVKVAFGVTAPPPISLQPIKNSVPAKAPAKAVAEVGGKTPLPDNKDDEPCEKAPVWDKEGQEEENF
jgi:alpha-tubulin suppressor-like RCC1 family protein